MAESVWADALSLESRSASTIQPQKRQKGYRQITCNPSKFVGGAEEDRTPDLRIANATLSQLSYRPNEAAILAGVLELLQARENGPHTPTPRDKTPLLTSAAPLRAPNRRRF